MVDDYDHPKPVEEFPIQIPASLLNRLWAFHLAAEVDTKAQRAAGDKARIDKEEIVRELVRYPAQYEDVEKNGTAGLFDRGIVKPGAKSGLPFRKLNARLGPMDAFHMGSQPFLKVNMDGKRFCTRASMKGHIQKANSIEELAKKLKLPVGQFKATVERYNRMAKAGVDEDFGKPDKDLIALETPPFYGATNAGWMMHTTDGIHINTDMQVLDTQGEVIDGLYAAGDVAGGFFGTNYYPELVVGIASGKTITFARHAILHMIGTI